MYVRHSAWLHAAPDVKGQEKLEKVSRLKRMRLDRKDETYQPDLPPCNLQYLIAVLYEVGPVMPGAMSAIPIDERELMAWQSNTGIELQPWESRMIKRLSAEYLSQSQESTKPTCPPPWVELKELDRPALAKNIRAMLRS